MGLIELFIIAAGLSMDAFAVSVCKGLSIGKINKRHMCIAGAWFGGFQAFMPLVGYFMGGFLAGIITKFSDGIAFIMLAVIGIGMIKDSFENANELDDSMTVSSMFMLAVATSIDALAAGVSFAFLRVNILPAVAFIGVITFICSAAGIKAGSIFGTKYKGKAELCGGIILIIIGMKILIGA